MAAMGFEPYLTQADQSYIITTYRYPADARFNFEEFYTRLSELGYVIYPGKLSQEPCFRVGTIGRLGVQDVEALLHAIQRVMVELEVSKPRS
jgi:2-aminoethylphosphonate-pyruvate transaminase